MWYDNRLHVAVKLVNARDQSSGLHNKKRSNDRISEILTKQCKIGRSGSPARELILHLWGDVPLHFALLT